MSDDNSITAWWPGLCGEPKMSGIEARARAYATIDLGTRSTLNVAAHSHYLAGARAEVQLERKRITDLLTKFVAPDEAGVIRITDSFLREIINGEGEA